MSSSAEVRLEPPPGVLEIAERLEGAGHHAWCVGGAIRDALLGHPPLDWDLATTATPGEMQRVFRRTVPKGIEFGTLGIFDSHGVMHEVTTLRRDVLTDGRKAVVEFGASLEDDLARRDFTINAIAYSPADRAIIDPFGGREDLTRGVVRAVGDASARMREDRLRALRAIRFASRFDFGIEDATWGAIVECAPHLGRLSAERVRDELEKTMEQVCHASAAMERWRAAGALGTLIPVLSDAPPARFATLDHLPRPTLASRPMRRTLRLAALWLDEPMAAVNASLRALRCANAQTRWIADLVERYARIAPELWSTTGEVPASMLRRWAGAAGRTYLGPLLRLASARAAAERAAGTPDAPSAARMRSVYRRAVRTAYRDPVEIADLAIDGSDLIAAGIRSGPLVGKILARLLTHVLEDPSHNVRDGLLARARTIADEISHSSGND